MPPVPKELELLRRLGFNLDMADTAEFGNLTIKSFAQLIKWRQRGHNTRRRTAVVAVVQGQSLDHRRLSLTHSLVVSVFKVLLEVRLE